MLSAAYMVRVSFVFSAFIIASVTLLTVVVVPSEIEVIRNSVHGIMDFDQIKNLNEKKGIFLTHLDTDGRIPPDGGSRWCSQRHSIQDSDSSDR